jgi:hypothetical protein
LESRPAIASLIAVAWCAVAACAGARVPDVSGTWTGPMMLQLGKGNSAFVDVEVVLEQSGTNVKGRWHTVATEEHSASGTVTGTLTRTASQQQVNVSFTFVGHHAGRPSAEGEPCQGGARASGSLNRNTTVGSGAPPEAPGWSIRLKAFDGFGFESCPPIRYATWTLARP